MSGALNLALKYRPSVWTDFAGQRPSVWTLFQMAANGRLPGAILLHGERGCGKTSMARVIARALNCESEARTARGWPCGQCPSCRAITAGSSVDVTEVDAASNGSVDTMREVRELAGYGTPGRARVFILDEAHAASGPAFDAMLKTLEEPALEGLVFFILVTTRLAKIPKTVRDRCHRFRFTPLPAAVITARLEVIAAAEGIQAGPGLLDAIARSSDGGMRDAIMKLDDAASAGITSLTMWRELTGITDFAPALLRAAAAADYPALFAGLDAAAAGDPGHVAAELVRCLTDLLVLGVPGGEISCDGEALESRRALAGQLGAARVSSALQVMWDLKARVSTGDPAADLRLAVSMISRRLAPAGAPAGPIAPDGNSTGALSRLRDVLGATSGQSGPV